MSISETLQEVQSKAEDELQVRQESEQSEHVFPSRYWFEVQAVRQLVPDLYLCVLSTSQVKQFDASDPEQVKQVAAQDWQTLFVSAK